MDREASPFQAKHKLSIAFLILIFLRRELFTVRWLGVFIRHKNGKIQELMTNYRKVAVTVNCSPGNGPG